MIRIRFFMATDKTCAPPIEDELKIGVFLRRQIRWLRGEWNTTQDQQEPRQGGHFWADTSWRKTLLPIGKHTKSTALLLSS
jgi:hypothetical protein